MEETEVVAPDLTTPATDLIDILNDIEDVDNGDSDDYVAWKKKKEGQRELALDYKDYKNGNKNQNTKGKPGNRKRCKKGKKCQ